MIRTLILLVAIWSPASGGLEMGRPFGSRMVLPMERPVPVWGSAAAGDEVVVEFGGQRVAGTADAAGCWRVVLAPMAACAEGRAMHVRVAGDSRALSGVLVGRVYLCSGQSNMDFPLARAVGGREEAAAAGRWPAIRLWNRSGAPTDNRVYDTAVLERLNPRNHFRGEWGAATAESAAGFSAVAWWAGKAIHQRTGVPVGLVENAVGGSGTEAWLPHEVLEAGDGYAELRGDGWLDSAKIGAWARGRAARNLGAQREANHPFRPGFLFESGVRDLAGFPFDGVLWYQGETNAEVDDPVWNERLITDLVTGWRAALGLPGLPFFMVQLPRIGGDDPLRRHWPEYRAVQQRAAARLERVVLVPTVDLGWDSPDVHPPDKRPLAERLGAAVLAGS